MKSDYFPRQH